MEVLLSYSVMILVSVTVCVMSVAIIRSLIVGSFPLDQMQVAHDAMEDAYARGDKDEGDQRLKALERVWSQ